MSNHNFFTYVISSTTNWIKPTISYFHTQSKLLSKVAKPNIGVHMAIVLQFLHNTLYDRCHCHTTKALNSPFTCTTCPISHLPYILFSKKRQYFQALFP